MRRVLAILIAALLVAACGSPEPDSPEGPARTSPTGASSDNRDGTAAADGRVDDDGALGSAGPELLAPSVPAVDVEIDRSPGADSAIDPRAVIGEKLREHGGKRSVDAVGDSEVPSQDVYTARDLRAITETSRASRSEVGKPAVYVLVLEGRYENERATGVAFGATAFAVFPGQIRGGLLGLQRDHFERAVVVHELGHLFGLVNLTGHGAFHEDPQHPGHSRNRESVMYWAVEDISVRNLFSGGPPTTFDRADRDEMAGIRGG